MRMEKINDSQVRFVVTGQDLRERDLTLKNLKYGSGETRRLFQDMLNQAREKYDFNNEELPIMVEAIPLCQEELLVIISVVEDADELDPHFSQFAPSPQDAAEGENTASPALLDTENTENAPDTFLVRFNTLDEVTRLCHQIFGQFSGTTLLYKPQENGPFYMAFIRPEKMPEADFLRFINGIREFGEVLYESREFMAYLKEHEKPVMYEPAIVLGLLDV